MRELGHLLSRAALKAITSQGRDSRTIIIAAKHLGLDASDWGVMEFKTPAATLTPDLNAGDVSLKQATDLFQRQLISATLAKHQGNQAAAARKLGIHRSNFYRLLQRYQIRPE